MSKKASVKKYNAINANGGSLSQGNYLEMVIPSQLCSPINATITYMQKSFKN